MIFFKAQMINQISQTCQNQLPAFFLSSAITFYHSRCIDIKMQAVLSLPALYIYCHYHLSLFMMNTISPKLQYSFSQIFSKTFIEPFSPLVIFSMALTLIFPSLYIFYQLIASIVYCMIFPYVLPLYYIKHMFYLHFLNIFYFCSNTFNLQYCIILYTFLQRKVQMDGRLRFYKYIFVIITIYYLITFVCKFLRIILQNSYQICS